MGSALAGKVVLVTGSARRLGAETARLLHDAGADLALHYRRATGDAQALAGALNGLRPGSAIALQADLLDTPRLPGLIAAVAERFGRVDALVNNASSFFPTPVGSITESHWDDLMGTNLKAPLFLAQAAAPQLRQARGTVVNIVDIHAERPLKSYPLYCTAKAGLVGLTRALAVELAPEVRVNGVAPGPIEWPEDDSFDAAARETIIGHTLLKRKGEALDVAKLVLFLLADATYLTGQIIAVDGGRTAHL